MITFKQLVNRVKFFLLMEYAHFKNGKISQELKVSLWLAALRSGLYKQTHNTLQDISGGYCCLGVITDICSKVTDITICRETRFNRLVGVSLSSNVRDWIGLTYHNGTFFELNKTVHNRYHTLSTLNDDGKSFNQIADIIESKPKGLFCG